MTISTHFPSIHTFLAPLKASKVGTIWNSYSPNTFALQASACAQSLDNFLAQAESYTGLERTIRTIEEVAASVAVTVPVLPRITRRPTYASHGSSVNIHRVLRGTRKAWHGTNAVTQPGIARTATLLLPCWFPWRMSETEIYYTMVANCAYAMALQATGLSLELVAFSPAANVWEQQDHVLTITLKALGDSWNMQALALLAQPAFLRRGIFRLYETMTPTYGPLYMDHYGTLLQRTAFPRILKEHTRWTPAQAVLFGADPYDRIQDLDTATAFVRSRTHTHVAVTA